MENNKKKKYYYYNKNNHHNSYYNHNYYPKKKKKKKLLDNKEIILKINENLVNSEYEGLLKKSVLPETYAVDNHKEIDLDNILVRKKEQDNIFLDVEDILVKKEKDVNNENKLKDLVNIEDILVKKSDDNKKITYDNLINIEREEPKKRKSFIRQSILGYAMGVLILVVAVFSSTYAFFNYYKDDSRQADIQTGEVYARITENNLSLSLSKLYPMTDVEARGRNNNYIDFNLVGKNTSLTRKLSYKFTLSNGDNISGRTRINPNYVLFDLSELDGNNNETLLLSGVTLTSFNSANLDGFEIPTNQTTELQKKYRIRAWISDSLTISDDPSENATYTQAQYANLFANFKVHINSQDVVASVPSAS